jgi:hypothetical protein
VDVLRVLVRSVARRQRGALVALAALVALGAGAGIAAFSIASRTDRAYPDYLRRSAVDELVVNPRFVTDRLIGTIRATPGVQAVVSDVLLNASLNDSTPGTLGESSSDTTAVVASLDGRYVTRDRPVVTRGRMIQSGAEAFVSESASRQLGLGVGDQLSVTFWPSMPSDAPSDVVVQPIATQHVHIVGVGVFADEVLPDELYPRRRVLISPDVARPYICLATQPERTDQRSIEELVDLFFPPGCASDARFFSIKVRGGDAGVDTVTSGLNERLADLSNQLPAALRQAGAGFSVIPTVTAAQRERIHQSLRPTVTTLRLLGTALIAAAIVLAGLAMLRFVRSVDEDTRVWHELGLPRRIGAAALGVPAIAACAAGVAAATILGWLGAAFGPIGSARAVVRSPDWRAPPAVAALIAAGTFVALALAVTAIVVLVPRVRRTERRTEPTSRLAGLALTASSVPLATGVRAALRRRGGNLAQLAALVIAVGLAVAAGLFSANLLRVLDTPASFGWPYDVGVVINYGFDGADTAHIGSQLGRPDVAAWGVGVVEYQATINGKTLPMVADTEGLSNAGISVITGTLPRQDHQIALGSVSARQLGLHVGDSVDVETEYGSRQAQITGLVVLPPIGAFLSDRAELGNGVLSSGPFFTALLKEGESAANLPAGALSTNSGGFVGIDLRHGIDPHAFVASIASDLRNWDANHVQPFVFTNPVHPPQIADVGSMRAGPVLLAALIALGGLAGVVLALHRAGRARRHELAVLRALGCGRQEVQASLRWQAIIIAVVTLVVGVPLGIVGGRMVWRSFADGLGIVPSPDVPVLALLGAVAVMLAVATAAAVWPARVAARTSAAAALRGE